MSGGRGKSLGARGPPWWLDSPVFAGEAHEVLDGVNRSVSWPHVFPSFLSGLTPMLGLEKCTDVCLGRVWDLCGAVKLREWLGESGFWPTTLFPRPSMLFGSNSLAK